MCDYKSKSCKLKENKNPYIHIYGLVLVGVCVSVCICADVRASEGL